LRLQIATIEGKSLYWPVLFTLNFSGEYIVGGLLIHLIEQRQIVTRWRAITLRDYAATGSRDNDHVLSRTAFVSVAATLRIAIPGQARASRLLITALRRPVARRLGMGLLTAIDPVLPRIRELRWDRHAGGCGRSIDRGARRSRSDLRPADTARVLQKQRQAILSSTRALPAAQIERLAIPVDACLRLRTGERRLFHGARIVADAARRSTDTCFPSLRYSPSIPRITSAYEIRRSPAVASVDAASTAFRMWPPVKSTRAAS
jgi:hypothetical protein